MSPRWRSSTILTQWCFNPWGTQPSPCTCSASNRLLLSFRLGCADNSKGLTRLLRFRSNTSGKRQIVQSCGYRWGSRCTSTQTKTWSTLAKIWQYPTQNCCLPLLLCFCSPKLSFACCRPTCICLAAFPKHWRLPAAGMGFSRIQPLFRYWFWALKICSNRLKSGAIWAIFQYRCEV